MADWIKGAIKKPGALTEQAKRAGMSITQFCAQAKDGVTKRRCSLRKTLSSFHHQ